MTDPETMRLDAKRDRFHDMMERVMPEDCGCGGTWALVGKDPTYGADADGRRGVMLYEWECSCGELASTGGSP